MSAVQGNTATEAVREEAAPAPPESAEPHRPEVPSQPLAPAQRRRFARSLVRSSGAPSARRERERDLRDILEGQKTERVLRRDSRVRRALALADLAVASIAMAAALLVTAL